MGDDTAATSNYTVFNCVCVQQPAVTSASKGTLWVINTGCSHLWYSLVALLIPGLPVDAVARHLPPIGYILTNLLSVTVPLTPLTVGLRCEAHCVLLTYRIIF